tara:strand:- start:412 stop:1284 length:873 start_codon:yes stop_codon:yes gene_type:complete
MAVPSSGQLRLRADINQEINDNDTDTNVSLGTLSDDAGFDAPDTMSEFYGYSAFTAPTITSNISSGSVTQSSMTLSFTYANPSAANLNHAWYFGTNSNRTSNTLYSGGQSTSTNNTVTRSFSSLNSGTTYYYWGVVWDTESPERFPQLITNGSRTTPQPPNPLTATKRQCTGGGNNDCTTLVAAQYNSNTTVYFDGIYDITHTSGPYSNPASTMRVYASYVNGSRNDHINSSITSPTSWYAAGSYGFGACYCGWSTVLWSFQRSGYSGQGGEWCKVGAQSNLPAFLYNTC